MTENVKHVEVLREWLGAMKDMKAIGYPLIEPSRMEAIEAAIAALQREAAGDGEGVKWWNGCDRSVPAALRYLAEHDRPIGGEQRFNSAHLYQLAAEIERMASQPLYTAPRPTGTAIFAGITINEAPGLPDGVATVRDGSGKLLATITGITDPDARGGGEAVEPIVCCKSAQVLRELVGELDRLVKDNPQWPTSPMRDRAIAALNDPLGLAPHANAFNKAGPAMLHPTPAALDAERLDWLSQSHNIRNETVLNGYGNLRDRIDAARATTGGNGNG